MPDLRFRRSLNIYIEGCTEFVATLSYDLTEYTNSYDLTEYTNIVYRLEQLIHIRYGIAVNEKINADLRSKRLNPDDYRCRDCMAWESGTNKTDHVGYCRRNPPTNNHLFPITKADDWCSQCLKENKNV